MVSNFLEVYAYQRGSTIGLAGCGIWLFLVVILEMRAKKKEREARILVMRGSGISYFYWVGMRES